MTPTKNLAVLQRDGACNDLQCLSSTAKIGIAMCIVLVTVGGAFTYYWAFIRGRRNKDTDSQIDDSVHELSVIVQVDNGRPPPHHRSPDADDQTIIHRPTPVPSDTPDINSQQTPNDIAMRPGVHLPHVILPGPPILTLAYVIHQQPVLVPILSTVALPSPPSAPSCPWASPGPPRRPNHRALRHDQRRESVQPRQPSPGYASTISDSSSTRSPSSPIAGRHSRRDSPVRARSRSSSLGTESRTRFEDFVTHSGVTESVNKDSAYTSEESSAANRSNQPRYTSDIHPQEDQSRVGRPRIQTIDEPRLTSCRAMPDVLAVGDTRMGREHHHESRGRRQCSRPHPMQALFSAGESHVGRRDPGHRLSREDHRDPSHARPWVRELLRVRGCSVGKERSGSNTIQDRPHNSSQATHVQDIQELSPAQSDISSTGAICSFEGSDHHQVFYQGGSYAIYRRGPPRNLSTERGLARPRRVLGNPDSLLSPRSTDSRDLSLASDEDDTEDDGRPGQHN